MQHFKTLKSQKCAMNICSKQKETSCNRPTQMCMIANTFFLVNVGCFQRRGINLY